MELEENIDIALEIVNTLVQNKKISKSENEDLYNAYTKMSEVGNLTDRIAEKMGFNIYRFDNTLNLCVMLDNKVFGYTNEELKQRVKLLNKNEDIYLMYFIVLTIIVCFYRESGLNSPRSYLNLDELLETINIKIQSLVKEDIDQISKEKDYNFSDIKKVWERLPDGREDITSIGKNDKISFVKLILRFMQDEQLIYFDDERQIISITTRFKAIVYYYFENSKENKNQLLEYVYRLGGEEDATY